MLWKFVFDKVGFADSVFINELSYTDYGDIFWKAIEKTTNEKISIKEGPIINKEDTKLSKKMPIMAIGAIR